MRINLKKAISVFCILISIVVSSCERRAIIKSDDFSDFSDFSSNRNDTVGILKIDVKKIILEEVDKRRKGLMIYPDDIGVKIEISISNNSGKIIHLPIRIGNSPNSTLFFGYSKTIRDSIIFVNSRLTDTLQINVGDTIDISFVSFNYDFEGLFEKKEDYTSDMINFVNGISFKYYMDNKHDSAIKFMPDKNTFLYRQNTY